MPKMFLTPELLSAAQTILVASEARRNLIAQSELQKGQPANWESSRDAKDLIREFIAILSMLSGRSIDDVVAAFRQ